MFENIPNMYIVAVVSLAIVGFIAVMMCVSRYLENEKDNAVKRKDAMIAGTTYDTVNEALSKKFWYGYLIVAVAGALISSVLALVITDIVGALYPIEDPGYILILNVALSVVVWVIGDRYLFTRLGDNAYFAKVEARAISAFLGDTVQDEVKDEPEPAPEDVALNELTLTAEQRDAIIDMLFGKKK